MTQAETLSPDSQPEAVSARFIAAECLAGDQVNVLTIVLYNAYKQWCEANGLKPKNAHGFDEDCRTLGFKLEKHGQKQYWAGVVLAAKYVKPDDRN